MANRPCMMCNAPLGSDGDCSTPGCIYNPNEDTKTHDAEFEYVEGKGGDTPGPDDTPDWGMSQEEMQELLDEGEVDEEEDLTPSEIDELASEGKGEREDSNAERQKPKKDKLDSGIDQNADDADDRMGDGSESDEAEDEAGGDEGDMDTSEIESEGGEDETHAENDAEDKKGQLDTTEDLPEQKPEKDTEKQLSEDEDGDEPSDDAHDLPDPDDDELPPRPQGCNGDCKPTDDPGGDDSEPCPHCTAKQFREQMREEGKEQLPEEEMESEWQDFLDNWEHEAAEHENENGLDEPESEQNEGGGKGDGDAEPDDDYVPDPEDDDLPPRPQGCSGNCAEDEDPDGDGEPCPHCTAKRFKEGLRDELEQGERDEVPTPDELAEMFQEMLDKQRERMNEPEDKPEPEPEDSDEDQSEGNEGEKEKPKRPDFNRTAKELTVTQEKRFDNLVQRLMKKVEGTFGNTAEEISMMPKTEGQFQGEELSQAIEVRSRGVIYYITLSAAKDAE
jgi:hypothetical protein